MDIPKKHGMDCPGNENEARKTKKKQKKKSKKMQEFLQKTSPKKNKKVRVLAKHCKAKSEDPKAKNPKVFWMLGTGKFPDFKFI